VSIFTDEVISFVVFGLMISGGYWYLLPIWLSESWAVVARLGIILCRVSSYCASY
jgi:hypothetical protein